MPKIKRIGGIILSVLTIVAPVGFFSQVHADTDLKFSDFVKEVRVGGDYRLRYDNQTFRDEPSIGQTALGEKYRERFRMRLRIGAEFILPKDFGAKFRLASGTGEQGSTNQTFTNDSSQKQIWIDLANAYWKPFDSVKITGGRMELPLWWQASSDLNWDPDYNPEGLAENFNTLIGDKVNIFANAMQIMINENVPVGADAKADQKEFSEQVGIEFRLPLESRLKLAYAYHDFQNISLSTMSATSAGAGVVQEGNSWGNNGLLNNYGVSEVQGELSGWVGKLPLSLQGTFIQNNRAKPNPLVSNEKRNTGYQTGFILGKAKEEQSFEAAYFYKYLGADSTPADIADSDFGDGGTNRFGHIVWVAYNPTTWLQIKTKYWMTKNVDDSFALGTKVASNQRKGDINRIMVDAMVKF